MTALNLLLLAWLTLALLYWLWAAYAAIRTVQKVPLFAASPDEDLPDWPRLSVIVAARNEEESIRSAAASLLAQDYPNLQIVLVDDRSDDRTGAIIDDLARGDARVRPVHVSDLPPDWLGKVHAMREGLIRSDGAYVLFTDADVHFAPGVCRRAVAWCERDRLDLLAALPGLWPTGRLLTAMMLVFLRQLNMRMRFWAVGDDRSRAFMGVGAFNLVRRGALERTEGLDWLRMEVADDAGLGMMMKRSGFRCRLCNARGWLGLHWYRTIAQMVAGMEKGYAPVADCRLWRAGLSIVMMLAVELAPVLALAGAAGWLAGGGGAMAWVLLAGGGAMLACAVAGSRVMRTWTQTPAWALPLWPVAALVVAGGFARSAVRGFMRGGVRWRDTFYTCGQLRRGRRVKL